MSIPGGISICSGGGFRVATNKEKAFEYLKATNEKTIDECLLDQFSEEMVKLPSLLKELGKVNNANITILERPANYPLPGYEAFQFMEYDSIPGFDQAKEFPRAKSGLPPQTAANPHRGIPLEVAEFCDPPRRG